MSEGSAGVPELYALCDFAAGSSVRQIARRYHWSINLTEAHIRRGFIAYGFGPGSAARRSPRGKLARVVSRLRPSRVQRTTPPAGSPFHDVG